MRMTMMMSITQTDGQRETARLTNLNRMLPLFGIILTQEDKHEVACNVISRKKRVWFNCLNTEEITGRFENLICCGKAAEMRKINTISGIPIKDFQEIQVHRDQQSSHVVLTTSFVSPFTCMCLSHHLYKQLHSSSFPTWRIHPKLPLVYAILWYNSTLWDTRTYPYLSSLLVGKSVTTSSCLTPTQRHKKIACFF